MHILTKRGNLDNVITYEHICDTTEDMAFIERKYITLGSTCVVLQGEGGGMEVYMADSNKEWHDIMVTGGNEATTAGLELHVCTAAEVQNGKPNIDTPLESTLYLVPSGAESGNLYDEYVYVNEQWELFGGARVSLDGYATESWVQQQGYLTRVPHATETDYGTIKLGAGLAQLVDAQGNDEGIGVLLAPNSIIKQGTQTSWAVPVSGADAAAFYGLAKAAGDTTQAQSSNAVGTYTAAAKTAIQWMLDVPSNSAIPTKVSDLTNDSGFITSFTETDPTVPAWAKAATKPTYTAAEVGAPTTQEMNSAIATAIGNSLPAPGTDGTALVSVNGEWTKTPGYGFIEKGEEISLFSTYGSLEQMPGSNVYVYNVTLSMMQSAQKKFIEDINKYIVEDKITYLNLYINNEVYTYTLVKDENDGDTHIIFYSDEQSNVDENYIPNGAVMFAITNSEQPSYTMNIAFPSPIENTDIELFINEENIKQIDTKYIPILGDSCNDGVALISVNNKWVKQAGYGYAKEEDIFVFSELSSPEFELENQEYNIRIPLSSEQLDLWDQMFYDQMKFKIKINDTVYEEGFGIDNDTSTITVNDNADNNWKQICRLTFFSAGESSQGTPEILFTTDIKPDYIKIYNSTVEYFTIDSNLLPKSDINIDKGIGECSIVMNDKENNTAIGAYSTAQGDYTEATGYASHAEGIYTDAKGEAQHVQGKYNIEDTNGTYAHIVGNGTSESNRSNAHTLDWNGNAWYAGKVTANGTPTNANDLTTKQYVDNAINGSTVSVSGTTPTVTADANTMYICGEVSTLSFTPAATGISDIIFESGSTATVLTVPNTVKFPDWFDATALEPNMVYEISIMNGTYGAVMAWATT